MDDRVLRRRTRRDRNGMSTRLKSGSRHLRNARQCQLTRPWFTLLSGLGPPARWTGCSAQTSVTPRRQRPDRGLCERLAIRIDSRSHRFASGRYTRITAVLSDAAKARSAQSARTESRRCAGHRRCQVGVPDTDCDAGRCAGHRRCQVGASASRPCAFGRLCVAAPERCGPCE